MASNTRPSTFTTFLCRHCETETEHRFLYHNSVTKPVYRCTECGDTHVGPMGEDEHRKLVQARQRAVTDGGRR